MTSGPVSAVHFLHMDSENFYQTDLSFLYEDIPCFERDGEEGMGVSYYELVACVIKTFISRSKS